MTVRKRGRPLGPSKQHLKLLQNPPQHILLWRSARGGETSNMWAEVMEDMEKYQSQIRAFGKKYRIKHDEVWTILSMNLPESKPHEVNNALASTQKSWKRMSHAGVRARGLKTPEWRAHAQALRLNPKYSNSSDREIASLVQDFCPDKKPDERTVRRYLKKL